MTASASCTLTEAINRLARGTDAEAVEAVQELLGADILRLCRRITGDHGLAGDACQHTLLHVISDAARFHAHGADADADVRRWTLRIATTSALALMRSRRRQQARELRWGSQQARAASDGDPAQLVAAQEDCARVRAAVEQLPEPYRSALVLRYLSEMSIADVALALDSPEESVRTRLRRGLAILRDLLRREGMTLGVAAAVRSIATGTPRAALWKGPSLLTASKLATSCIGASSPMHLIPSLAIAASFAASAALAAADSVPAPAASPTASASPEGAASSIMQVTGFDGTHQPILRCASGRTITLTIASLLPGTRLPLVDGGTKAPSELAIGDRLRLTLEAPVPDGWATITAIDGPNVTFRSDAGGQFTLDSSRWLKEEPLAVGSRMRFSYGPKGTMMTMTVISKDATSIHMRTADGKEGFVPATADTANWAVGSTHAFELPPGSSPPVTRAAPKRAAVDRASNGDLILVFDNGERVYVDTAPKTGLPVLHFGEVYRVTPSGSTYRLERMPTKEL